MLSILCVKLAINVKVWIPERFKVGWYRQKITGSSHLKTDYEIPWNKPPNTSQIVTCIVTNKGNLNFSQNFIFCVGLCTELPNIIDRNVVSVWP